MLDEKYKILVTKSECKKLNLETRTRCEVNIKTDVKCVDWLHVTQDRIQWRAVVNPVMDIWVL